MYLNIISTHNINTYFNLYFLVLFSKLYYIQTRDTKQKKKEIFLIQPFAFDLNFVSMINNLTPKKAFIDGISMYINVNVCSD